MMEDNENKGKDRGEIFSRAIRAGKRTYFFDVKTTVEGEAYLTITESKRRFNEDGKFFYEKHKLFLYKEDFDKFVNGLNDSIEFIRTGKAPDRPVTGNYTDSNDENYGKDLSAASHSIEFEDLTSEADHTV
jgi:Protein of unknown function (DUF3276)